LSLDQTEQQDPQEFNKLFLNYLEKLQAPVEDERLPTITSVVSGKERTVITCSHCNYESKHESTFHELNVGIDSETVTR